MKYLFRTAIVAYGLATSVQANDEIRAMKHGDLVNVCIHALELSQSVDAYAKELISRSRFNLGPVNAEKGARCLEAAFGFEYAFEGGRFVSHEHEAEVARKFEEGMREAKTREAELRRLALLATAEQELRERQYWRATTEVCAQMFYKDRFVALTNAACASVFKSQGLPE